MSEATSDAGGATGADAQQGMMAMYDLAAPQERYLELMAQGGYIEAMDGLGLSFNRANTEYVLRQPRVLVPQSRWASATCGR